MDQETRRKKQVMKNQERRRKLAQAAPGTWHSRFYHREFEGYAEHKAVGTDGKARLERVYMADYYRLAGTDGHRKRLKAAHVLLCLLACGLFATGAALPAGSNLARPMALLQMAGALLVFRMGFVVLRNLFTPAKMEIRQYKNTSRAILNGARLFAVVLALSATAALIYLLTHLRSDDILLEIVCILCYGAGAPLQLAQWRLEKRQVYHTVKNDAVMTNDMTMIE